MLTKTFTVENDNAIIGIDGRGVSFPEGEALKNSLRYYDSYESQRYRVYENSLFSGN